MASTTTTRPTTRSATGSAAARKRGEAAVRGPLFRAPAWLEGPMTSSQLVLGSAGLLLSIGLVMVFSASSMESALNDGSPWAPGLKQVAVAFVGLIGMFVALRLPVGHLRRWSGIALLLSFVLLMAVLVPGIGKELNGARQWINLGVTDFQPSEFTKLVFALWGAHVIAVRERWLTTSSLLVPVLPVFAMLSGLLILEPDMGAVVSLGLVLAGLLWAGGISGRLIACGVGIAAGIVALMVALAPYRLARVTSFLDPFADPLGDGFQAVRGLYALATGGFWGVGLGNSRMKWNLLPHAESDYIFAIIGEELGFLGCLVVITLYGVLAYAGFRIARRSADRFIQLASIAITVWLIGQATMNMGYVVGLLPVTGVQLPLVSAGGTSMVITLFIVGLLARFARSEPEAIAHLRAHRQAVPVGRLGRLGRWLLPVPPNAVDPLPTVGRRRPTADAPRRPAGRTVARVRDGRAPAPAAPVAPPARQTGRDRPTGRSAPARTPSRTPSRGQGDPRPRTDRPARPR